MKRWSFLLLALAPVAAFRVQADPPPACGETAPLYPTRQSRGVEAAVAPVAGQSARGLGEFEERLAVDRVVHDIIP